MQIDQSQLSPLIRRMLEPDFYPHSVRAPVELIQTHISFVLLTGEFAYKIKKPVQFDFVDFSTLEKRRHFCREEIRLNKRLAAELYVDVVSIGATSESHFVLSPESHIPVVEYAVKMHQFPEKMLLSRLCERGMLQETHILSLADSIAAFHDSADTAPPDYGNVEGVQQIAEDNLDVVSQYVGRTLSETTFQQLRDFTQRFLSGHRNDFVARIKDGRIRECHGDLHLNNVCLYDNSVCVFDCIEFNDRFRYIDVSYEIAFLWMDLIYRGRKDLAYAFINRYLEQSGDYDAASFLRFYGCMRSVIRGKVELLLLEEETVPDSEKADASERASQYLELAENLSASASPFVWIVTGFSGSGKSTIAAKLAISQDAIHLRSDAVRKHLAGLIKSGVSEKALYKEGIYSDEMTDRTYDRLTELAVTLGKNDVSVVVDATFLQQKYRKTLREALHRNGIPFQFIFCTAPEPILIERLNRRKADLSDADVEILKHQLRTHDPLTREERENCFLAETTRNPDEVVAEITGDDFRV